MKKMFFIFMLLIMLFSLLSYGLAADAKQEFLIKACVPSVSGEPATLGMQRFAELVEERSEGRIEMELFFDGMLGAAREEIEGVQLGTIEITQVSNSPMTSWVPSMNLFELPFLFKDPEHLSAVVESDIIEWCSSDLSEKGFHLLGFNTVGLRHLMTIGKEAVNQDQLQFVVSY